MYGDERVYVVPFVHTLNFVKNGYEHIAKEKIKILQAFGKYFMRADAEGRTELQQIIPYAYIKSSDNKFYYITKRIAGESRLIGKLSIGAGGHINPCDGYDDMIAKCLHREINEELILPEKYKCKYEGIVRDLASSTPDHLGVVYSVTVDLKDMDKVAIKEKDNLEGMWLDKEAIAQNYYHFESWAKYIIEDILKNK